MSVVLVIEHTNITNQLFESSFFLKLEYAKLF